MKSDEPWRCHLGASVALAVMCLLHGRHPNRPRHPIQRGSEGNHRRSQFARSTRAYYGFYLDLHFAANDPQDRARIFALAGNGETRSGHRVNNGLPIPVKLTVRHADKDAGPPLFDAIVPEQELEGYSATYFAKSITGLSLPPGLYSVRVDALQDIPDLGSVEVHFDVHPPSRE